MKMLLATRFHPAIGGLETVTGILADEWAAAGHEVCVATDVPGPPPGQERRFPFAVHHRPAARALLGLVRWCDVYIQACIGLKTLWPLAVHPRPYVASHHTWYQDRAGRRGWPERIKHLVARHAVNIACSQAVADHLSAACTVIPNPYRSDVFRRLPGSARDRDLIFVGRLVTDKGVALLLRAVAALRAGGLRPGVTLVGDGPERPALERETVALGLEEQVVFTGSKPPAEVAALLNRHRVLVVPSLWNEPFGVVALEGIACGCLAVVSHGGGLKEAIGPCGLTFPNGDAAALTERLQTLLRPGASVASQEEMDQHLAGHQPAAIAKRYADVMLAATNR